MSKHKKSPDHSSDIQRLKKIMGQLEGVQKMIGEGRYCYDILIQTKAARSALKSLEALILERHMNHCVTHALESKNKIESQKKIEELLDFFVKRID